MEDERNNANTASLPPLGKADSNVHQVVKAAQEELRQLLRHRATIMRRVGTLKQTIAGLALLYGNDILDEDLLELLGQQIRGRQRGFTEVCRKVLMEAEGPITTRESCERIQREIPDVLLRHKDLVASVTTVLSRLVEYGEVRASVSLNGRRTWQWITDRPETFE
jgi:hypothetical protein